MYKLDTVQTQKYILNSSFFFCQAQEIKFHTALTALQLLQILCFPAAFSLMLCF